MIEVRAIVNYFFYPEPPPSDYSVKAYRHRFPYFQDYLTYYQTPEFANSVVDGIYALAHFNQIRETHGENFSESIEIILAEYIRGFLRRYKFPLTPVIEFESDKKHKSNSITFTINGDKLNVECLCMPIQTKTESSNIFADIVLSKARKIYQQLFITKEASLSKTYCPEEKDGEAHKNIVISLVKNYEEQIIAFYFLEHSPFTKENAEFLKNNLEVFRKSKFSNYLKKECSGKDSVLMYFSKLYEDKFKFYQSAIYSFTDFPQAMPGSERSSMMVEYLELLPSEDKLVKMLHRKIPEDRNHQLRGFALSKLAAATNNNKFLLQALNTHWNALKIKNSAYCVKGLYEAVLDYSESLNKIELRIISQFIQAIFYTLPMYWMLYESQLPKYKKLKSGYIKKQSETAGTLGIDVKKIPSLFTNPDFAIDYGKKLKEKGASGIIIELVVGMLLWQQCIKLVLTGGLKDLLEFEADIYFVLKLEEEYFKDKSKNEEWTELVENASLDKEKMKVLEDLLRSNKLI
ncbi:MAG: hypothetical protein HW421_473 [Ignavibacteria bacterium]|nr:hypothetical protein [Ignavibacteria bacterium]